MIPELRIKYLPKISSKILISKADWRIVWWYRWLLPSVKSSFCFFADEDSNGSIDKEELRKCFHKLETAFTDEEIYDLFETCDINEDRGMKFNEFIVLLCLVYLLKDDPATPQAVSWTEELTLHLSDL